MRTFLLLLFVTASIVTIVMAVVFRNQRARGMLGFLRKLGWGYVIAIVALAAWRLYEGGF